VKGGHVTRLKYKIKLLLNLCVDDLKYLVFHVPKIPMLIILAVNSTLN